MPKSTPESVLRHVFKGCRDNSQSTVEKWVANPLFDAERTNDGVWSDSENRALHNVTPLHIACKYWGDKTVKLLLEAGADPNAKGSTGATPLMFCAFFDNIKAMKLLIQHGVDLNAVNDDGFTALTTAAVDGRIECIKLLVSAGADLDVATNEGLTAYQYAIKWKETEAALLLNESSWRQTVKKV